MATDPERGSGREFQFVNYYGTDSLYTLLVSDNQSHSLPIQNNWEKIRVHGFDPILNLDIHLRCDPASVYDSKTGDRNARVARFNATMEVRAQKETFSLNDFAASLDKQGLDLDYTNIARSDTPLFPHKYFVSREKAKIPIALKILDAESQIYTAQLFVPPGRTVLDDENLFSVVKDALFDTLEKVMKAIYDYEEKDLPKVTLVFKAEKENSAFLATCSYCRRNYYTDQNLTCPGCGATEPKFI